MKPSSLSLFWPSLSGVVSLVILGFMGGFLSCPAHRSCQTHDDCLAGEICNTTSQTCQPSIEQETIAKSQDSGQETENLVTPEHTDTETKDKEDQSNKTCSNHRDCREGDSCNPSPSGGSHCRPLCLPGRQNTQAECECPPDWEKIAGECHPPCPSPMKRKEGSCDLDLTSTHPAYWESDAAGNSRLKCPQGWIRDTKGECLLSLSKPAISASVGPNKPCPSDESDKWDEDYLQRANLPTNTPTRYVDAAASSIQPTGTKIAPYPTIQQALQQAPKGAVILVAPGLYAWGINISESLHLVGRCTDGVKIQPSALQVSGKGIDVSAPSPVVLEGFTLHGQGRAPGWGIYSQSTNPMITIQHVKVQQAKDAGIRISTGRGVLFHVEVLETKREQAGYGLNFSRISGESIVSFSHIHHNEGSGALIYEAERVVWKENVVSHNGQKDATARGLVFQSVTQRLILHNNLVSHHPGEGVFIATVQPENLSWPDVNLRQNTVTNNGDTGILLRNSSVVQMDENLVFTNGRKKNTGRGIHIQDVSGSASLSRNWIHDHPSYGLSLSKTQEVKITQNVLEKNGVQRSLGEALALSQISRSILIEGNLIRDNFAGGILLSWSKDAQLISNVIADNSRSSSRSHGVAVQYMDGSVTLAGNHITKHMGEGILALSLSELHLRGNQITHNGNIQEQRHGIHLTRVEKKLSFEGNLIAHQLLGVVITYANELHLTHNHFHSNGLSAHNSAAILLFSITQSLKVTHNLIRNHAIGTRIAQIEKDTVVNLSHNAWIENQYPGLLLEHNASPVTIERNLFFRNGGTHLRSLNNRAEVSVQHNSFLQAQAADASETQGLGRSAGMGIYAGAAGLVRWVFARQADFPCSPTQEQRIPSLLDGWVARPVIVPYAKDPCQTWQFRDTFRTDQQRRGESRCQSCYTQGKGCRWIWKEGGVGSSRGKGLWEPTEEVVCVDASSPDTCERPPSFQYVSLRPLYTSAVMQGQCLSLPPTTKDPCEAPFSSLEMQICQGDINAQKSYCGRIVTQEGNASWLARCYRTDQPHTLCRPQLCSPTTTNCFVDVCKKLGLPGVCVENWQTSLPADPFPSQLRVQNNVFWLNPGPDILLDTAGQVSLENNLYVLCPASSAQTTCAKTTYRQRFLPQTKSLVWEEEKLPPQATIVWQNPSIYPDPAWESRRSGNDFSLVSGGSSMVYEPSVCQTLVP